MCTVFNSKCIRKSDHSKQRKAWHNIINTNPMVSQFRRFPWVEARFRGAVSCVNQPFVHLSFLLPGGQASVRMCQFAVIISICSHLKRLANPRSHASSAPRIICVCFLTQRRDCVNLLRGKGRERKRESDMERDLERRREREKEKPMSCSQVGEKRKTRDIWERRQETGDSGKGRRQGKNKVKREILESLCSLQSAVVLVGRNVQSCVCHQTNVMYDLDLECTKSRRRSSCQGQQGD